MFVDYQDHNYGWVATAYLQIMCLIINKVL